MSDREHYEKGEKEEEKEAEKAEKEEKSWDEKWRRDPLSALVWAAILIWAGLVLLASNLGLLVRFEQVDAWGFIFIGAALILLLEVVVRLLMPDFRRPVAGTFILAIILLAIGLGNLVNWGLVWPLVLIIIGVSIVVRGFFWRR
jgi:low affinity Fe/Cu permease